MTRTGLDLLLASPDDLAGRRYGLLAHGASVTRDLRPIHRALAAVGQPPAVLFGPEHGFYGIEQDMVAAEGGRDPWTGVAVHSLYGDDEATLRPQAQAFAGLDLLLVDLQDVGSRYYTYAATAVWAAEAALAAGCEVWVLDRPNPLGGEIVEGNRPQPGEPDTESFVGAFDLPVRHGLTLGELVLLEARRRGWPDGDRLRIREMEGWRRGSSWEETGLPWIAPSPNMPTLTTALIYPGGCLVEAT
ncbi:MAG TPA: exo-beta-N-acetylmuramidase NamZ domain-containing protein, partial [Thermoanaerobaculia bacterium]|nr:exo-beta-N-acetylmuramidase NamZ domain-containing protein [Thermoanaerobaculia bacterium]